MTPQTQTPSTVLSDEHAAVLLSLALHTPGGVTAPIAAAAFSQREAWVYRHLDAGIEDGAVTRLGPDLRTRAGRYQATRVTVTPAALLAGALLALTERGWTPEDLEGDGGRVDLSGALRLAGGVHPFELPDDETVLVAVFDAEDELARHLGADPHHVDAGDLLALWQSTPGVDTTRVVELLLAALAPLTATGAGR